MNNSVCQAFAAYFGSSIGKKVIVAVTGIALLLFLAGHLAGNLLIYVGPEAINEYAHTLRELLHGSFLWIARAGLLLCFVLHVTFTVLLVKENRGAREGARYEYVKRVQTTWMARTMILSGLVIFAFVIYHLLHFTLQVTDRDFRDMHYDLHGTQVHDVYSMVVAGFSHPLMSIFYIISMALLSAHLAHGFASVFQTLGLRTQKMRTTLKGLGYAYAAVIFFGNISIPLSVMLGIVKPIA